jgi:hypothetical protein
MSAVLILCRELDGHQIGQRQSDGFVNATALCKAGGKLWGHYWENQRTRAFVEALSAVIGIPIVDLIQSQSGRPDLGGGTWTIPV